MACKALWVLTFLLVFKYSFQNADIEAIDQEIRILENARGKGIVRKGCTRPNIDVTEWCSAEGNDDVTRDQSVSHGTLCAVSKNGASAHVQICSDGEWKTHSFEENGSPTMREKRSHRIRCIRKVGWWWKRKKRCKSINHRPYFTRCKPPTTTFNTSNGASSMKVMWPEPTAYDDEIGTLGVRKVYVRYKVGSHSSIRRAKYPHNGDVFQASASGRYYTITYRASDGSYCVTCTFPITVKVITCSPPNHPTNGIITCSNGIHHGDTCMFSCNRGYTRMIASTTCQSNQRWSHEGSLVCQVYKCPYTQPSLANGWYSCPNSNYGTQCTSNCYSGYDVNPVSTITCTEYGWVRSGPAECKDVNPPTVNNCPSDMIFEAAPRETTAVVQWIEPTATDAEETTAPTIKRTGIAPGSVNVEGTYPVVYQAFDTTGNPSAKCSFSASVRVIRCPALMVMANAVTDCSDGMLYGSVCSFTCNQDYRLQGESSTLCQKSGVWSDAIPTCSDIICPTPESLGHTFPNGMFECPDQVTMYDACTSRCDDGYRQDVEVLALCSVGDDGSPEYVIGGTPECIDNTPPEFTDCNAPVTKYFEAERGTRHAKVTWSLPNATDNIDPSPVVQQTSGPLNGSFVEANSNTYVKFQALDSDKNPSEKCVYVLNVTVIECPELTNPANGYLDRCDNMYGSTCSHTCVPGYTVSGESSSECLADGTWSSSLECSGLHCLGPLPTFDNGEYICNDTTYNSWCQPVCDVGFELKQGFIIRCDESQNWNQIVQPVCRDNEAPVLLDCVPMIIIKADAGEVCAVVDIEPPTATDNVDQSVNVTQISGPANGDCIESDALIKYEAVDNAGNPSDVCVIHVRVRVIECPSLQWPEHGRYICNNGNIYGSTCIINCKEGYEASTNSSISCTVAGIWLYDANFALSCSPISCGMPQTQEHGSFACADFDYLSVCFLQCNQGFSTGTLVITTCEGNKQWLYSSREQCTDSSPPIFSSCIAHQSFYIDRGMTTASVTWEEPTAVDNVDTPDILVYTVIPDLKQGDSFPLGSTFLQYTVTDSAGNPSLVNCGILITVEDVICPSPRTIFSDANLIFGCPSFRYGIPCDVTCRNTTSKSFNLIGPSIIMCEATMRNNFPTAYWEYNGTQPYCDEIMDVICQKNLHVPANGAITYTNSTQPLAFISCNKNYSLPLDHAAIAFCLDHGEWKPSVISDCVELVKPEYTSLSVEYTYSGYCNETEIKSKILTLLESFAGTQYAPPCLTTSTCDFDDLTVSCGNTTRKKRTTGNIFVSLRLNVLGEVSSGNVFSEHEQTLFELSDAMQQAADNGDFNIEGLEFESYERDVHAHTECTDPGTHFRAFKCLPCGKGRYMTTSSDGQKSCVDCPVGTYNDVDVALSCFQCPEGFSTNTTAASSLTMCLEMCSPSHISPNGLKPCSLCPFGSYQTQVGQTSCISCPAEQTTIVHGAVNCSAYDIRASPGSYEVPIVELTEDLASLSISFWLHLTTRSGFRLLISQSTNEPLYVGISADWDNFDQSLNLLNVQIPSSQWIHFVLILDTEVTVIENGISIASTQLDPSVLFTTGSRILMKINSENEIRLSGLGMFSHTLTSAEISPLLSSCVLDESINATIRTNDVLSAQGSVPIHADPATCIVTNYCLSNPCGSDGQCRPDTEGYVCFCKKGHSGTNCEIGPNPCIGVVCLNGGACQDGKCICPNGYRGEFCGKAPVSGGWSDWSSWGECSTSCDEGIRQRHRTCNSPPPDAFGEKCAGDSDEDGTCNIIACSDLNKCKGNPCGNLHKCVEQPDGYTCKCAAGYSGDHCEIQPDSCAMAVCLNGGTCVPRGNRFACQCPELLTGVHCENVISLQISWTKWSVCSAMCNGGTSTRSAICVPPSDDPVCSSNETRNCNSEPCLENLCVSSPCGDHTCISSAGGFECICNAGHTGVTCGEVIDHCMDIRCVHGACVNLPTGYLCECTDGYSGALCDKSPVNGGWGIWTEWGPCSSTCSDGTRSRTRQCNNPAPSLGGRDCSGSDVEKLHCSSKCEDHCVSSNCGDHGTCVPTDTDYSCYCYDGYTGPLCDTPPDQCDGDPCLNGGTCYSNETNFYCVCQAGFSGGSCLFTPVDSAWLPWSEWSECSASCARGEQTRERVCELGSNRFDCGGKDLETRECNVENCPECEPLISPYGVMKVCNSSLDNQTIACAFRCIDGLYVTNGSQFIDTYQCGPETSFQWDQEASIPSCSPRDTPETMIFRSQGQMSPRVSCANQTTVRKSMENILSSTPCYNNSNCKFSVQLDSCSTSRTKRQDDVDATTITYTMEVNFEEINETDSNVTDIIRQTQDDGIQTISIIDSIALYGLEVDGVTYSIDASTSSNDTTVICPLGYILEDEMYCIGCSPGTMYDVILGYCVSCPVGTYQENKGQTFCEDCPFEYGHDIIGSWNSSDCRDLSMLIPPDRKDATTPLGLMIGIPVGVISVIVMIVVGVVMAKKVIHRNRAHQYEQET